MDPTPETIIRTALRATQQLKNQALRSDPDATIPTVLEIHRQGRLVIRAAGNISHLLPVMSLAVPAFASDGVLMVSDTYAAIGQETNPITGQEWQMGDMNTIAEQDAAVERGLLQEMLVAYYERRPGGRAWQATMSYRRRHGNKPARRFLWDEMDLWAISDEDYAREREGSRIPTRISEAWTIPTAASSIPCPQAEADAMTLRYLANNCPDVVIAAAMR